MRAPVRRGEALVRQRTRSMGTRVLPAVTRMRMREQPCMPVETDNQNKRASQFIVDGNSPAGWRGQTLSPRKAGREESRKEERSFLVSLLPSFLIVLVLA